MPFINMLVEMAGGAINTPAVSPLLRMILDRGYSRGAEIGVWIGTSSKAILDMPTITKLYMVDPWREGNQQDTNYTQENLDIIYERVKRRVSQYGPRKEILRMTSNEANSIVPHDLDFVFIDGDHRYDAVRSDILHWAPKIRKGGVLCGDDYHLWDIDGKGVQTELINAPEVRKAVDDTFAVGVVKHSPWSYWVGDYGSKDPLEHVMPERFWYVEWEDLWKRLK